MRDYLEGVVFGASFNRGPRPYWTVSTYGKNDNYIYGVFKSSELNLFQWWSWTGQKKRCLKVLVHALRQVALRVNNVSHEARSSHYHKSCRTICDWDQNGIKQSRCPSVVNQTIKKVFNWVIKHLTKVTCKQNNNWQGFPGFPVSTSSDQDILKTKSSD